MRLPLSDYVSNTRDERKHILFLDSVDYLLDMNFLPLVVLCGKDGVSTCLELLHEYPVDGEARSSCLKTTGLAAVADLVVVQEREMSDFSREAGLSV